MTDLATKTGAFDVPDDDDISSALDELTLDETDELDAVDADVAPDVDADIADADAADADAEAQAAAEPSDDTPEDLVEAPAETHAAEPAEADAAPTLVVPAAAASPTPTLVAPTAATEPAVQWAPAEPARRKRRLGLWIGIPAGVVAAGVVAASLILIAPGTTVAGVPVGGLTPGAAADAISERLAETTIVLTGAGGGAELTGADLAASVNARDLANEAFEAHPMWNPTTWFAPAEDAVVQLDRETAAAALRDAAPSLHTDPVDATLTFDAASGMYVVTPQVQGTGVDVDTVRAALQDAFDSGRTRVELEPVAVAIDAETQTYVATATADRLNGLLDTIGFYIGDERTVPVDRATAGSWITLGDGPRGTFSIDIDEQAVQAFVDTLPGLIDRPAVNQTVVTNSSGRVLRTLSEGVEGRTLETTDGIAAGMVEQMLAMDGVYQLPVTVVPFTTTALARTIEVNLSSQRAYLFENGNLVSSHQIASGLPDSPTPTGHFTVNGYSRVQNMGCFEGAPYCVRDVPWVTWFAPDIGFHGANSLRSSLGYPQSHGCVNMWDDEARFVYEWSAMGTEVWVHY